MFSVNQEKIIDLAPLYDYEYFFDSNNEFRFSPNVFRYDSYLFLLEKTEDYQEAFHKYPDLKEKVSRLGECQLMKLISEIEEEKGIDMSFKRREFYKKEEEVTQKFLAKILR